MAAPGGGGVASVGYCWVDVLLAMALAALVAAMAAPLTARTVDAIRSRDAAAFVAGHIRIARQQAVQTTRAVAVVFDREDAGWTFRLCRDGNGNGVRRSELSDGRDTCFSGPWSIGTTFSGASIALDPSVPAIDEEAGGGDAVRFSSDMSSCTSGGGCTAGTVYVRSAAGDQYAVRVGGTGGRVRTLRFDRGVRRWVAE